MINTSPSSAGFLNSLEGATPEEIHEFAAYLHTAFRDEEGEMGGPGADVAELTRMAMGQQPGKQREITERFAVHASIEKLLRSRGGRGSA